MKIIFSPSKEMNFEKESLIGFSEKIEALEKTKKIYEILIQLSREEISKRFKIKGEILEKFLKDLNDFESLKEKPAVEAYSGLSFRQLLLNDYTDENFQFVYEHLIILSALYGYTRGTELIKNHRLDFSIKVFEEMSLYKYWEDYANDIFQEGELIFNLASKEYSKLINNKKVNMINFEFYENEDFKQISANSKKARGEMLNLIIINQITEVEKVKILEMKEYFFKKELSSKDKIVFIKK